MIKVSKIHRSFWHILHGLASNALWAIIPGALIASGVMFWDRLKEVVQTEWFVPHCLLYIASVMTVLTIVVFGSCIRSRFRRRRYDTLRAYRRQSAAAVEDRTGVELDPLFEPVLVEAENDPAFGAFIAHFFRSKAGSVIARLKEADTRGKAWGSSPKEQIALTRSTIDRSRSFEFVEFNVFENGCEGFSDEWRRLIADVHRQNDNLEEKHYRICAPRSKVDDLQVHYQKMVDFMRRYGFEVTYSDLDSVLDEPNIKSVRSSGIEIYDDSYGHELFIAKDCWANATNIKVRFTDLKPHSEMRDLIGCVRKHAVDPLSVLSDEEQALARRHP